MSLAALKSEPTFYLGVGDVFLDPPTGMMLTIMDTALADDGSAWCATSEGVQFDCPLPDGWEPSGRSIHEANDEMLERVTQWAADGRHHALYWLSLYYQTRDTPKSVWYLIAAYRKKPEEYRDLFFAVRDQYSHQPGGPEPEFVLDIPEFREDFPASLDWHKAYKRAAAL